MRTTMSPAIFASALLLSAVSLAAQDELSDQDFFNQQVLPLLRDNCFECHGQKKQKGELRLDSYTTLLAGGELGKVVVPGDPDKSLLIKAIRYEDPDLQMPPKKRLSPEQVAVLEKWVKLGLPWPGADQTQAPTPIPAKKNRVITAEDRSYWAYQPVKRPAVPAVRQTAWVTNPIDAFIMAGLEAAGIGPNPPAGKRELIRRAYYDLIGLPPTPQQIEAFLADNSPNAYEKRVDELLQSPQYGQKWGRHWLDIVRYAETNGYERDGTKPNAWRYRDYVIQSLNNDKPYDAFIREQIAGDERHPTDGQAIIATGFYRLGVWDDEPADPEQARYDSYDDIVSITAQTFLGMTVNCARCHDHKVDPILQADYYRLLAFFRDIGPYSDTRDVASKFNTTDIFELTRPPQEKAKLKALADQKAQSQREAASLENEAIKKMPREDQIAAAANDRRAVVAKIDPFFNDAQRRQYAALKQEIKTLDEQLNIPRDLALSVNHCDPNPPQTHVLIRGSAHAQGDPVEPGFPQVLGFDDPKIPPAAAEARSSGRRRVLADWLASSQNPLTARVMVNRLWQHHFGRGIVRSSNDFGKLGEKPTHPQLLDWLASEFVSRGWRLKAMHKLIMLSSAYRMASADNTAALARDPTNELFWRLDMRRLTAEEIRDSILAVNGTLNPQMGGPSIYTPIPQEVLAGASMPDKAWGKSPPDQQARRSVYIFVKRSLVEPVLATFDLPDADSTCPVRFATTVPTQSLTMLNSQFMSDQAAALARRLKKEAGDRPEAQITLALQLALQRAPKPHEIQRGIHLMQAWQQQDGLSKDQALQYYCLMVLNLNEFVYLE